MISAVSRLLSLAVALIALGAVPALAAGGKDRLAGDCVHSQVKPSDIVLACADDNTEVGAVKWIHFGGKQASGTGRYGFNNCTPNCVSGTFHYYPVSIVAAKPKRCQDGYDDYQSLRITFTRKPPKGFSAHLKTPLYCPL
jgi:hypothetical protein